MAQPIRLDITSLTLGEAAEAEEQSGKSIQALVKGRATMLLLAVFVHELRSSEQPRSWSELANLPLLDVSSLISQSQPDGQSVKSSD
jgi:hypothetical protein